LRILKKTIWGSENIDRWGMTLESPVKDYQGYPINQIYHRPEDFLVYEWYTWTPRSKTTCIFTSPLSSNSGSAVIILINLPCHLTRKKTSTSLWSSVLISLQQAQQRPDSSAEQPQREAAFTRLSINLVRSSCWHRLLVTLV
jgi:hypothetical protein